MRAMQQKLDAITKALGLNPTMEDVEAALQRRSNAPQWQDRAAKQRDEQPARIAP